MPTVYKVLGQVAPFGVTETDLYTVPAATSAVASSIIICNRSAYVGTFRVSISVGGGVTANKDYIYYDVMIASKDTFIATVGLTLAAGDKVRIYAAGTGGDQFSFSLYGSELT